jgi:hypothetical protein
MYSANRKVLAFNYIKDLKIKAVPCFFQVRVKQYKINAPFHQEMDRAKISRFYWLSVSQGFGVANNILGSDSLSIKEGITHRYFIDNKFYDELSQSGSIVPMKGQEMNPLYRGEVFFLKSDNSASFNYFSPNKLEISASIADSPDILIINQRYDTGWKCDLGKLRNWNGLLGVELKGVGGHSVRLRYRPAIFFYGLGISILTILYMGCFWRKYN